jgi:hypothetical protein
MPDGETADRTGSEVAETLSENNALELRVVGRPHRDDLRMLSPVECFIDPEARKRFLAEDAADGEDEIAVIGKRDMVPGRRDQPIVGSREKSGLERIDRDHHQRAADQILVFRNFRHRQPPAHAGMLQPQPRLRSTG